MVREDYGKQKDIVLILLGVAVIVLVLMLVFKDSDNRLGRQPTNTTKVSIAPSGMKYPAGWQEVDQITMAEKQDGVISKALHTSTSSTAIIKLISGQLDKNVDINKIPDLIVSKLKGARKNFKLVKSSVTTLGKNKVVSINYIDTVGQLNFQHTQTIVPTADNTYYLTTTVRVSDFNRLQTDINAITEAFGNYINEE